MQLRYTLLHLKSKICITSFIVILILLTSCKKFITLSPPPNRIISDLAFSNDATATAAVTGIYSEMMNYAQQFSNSYTTILAGLSAQELKYFIAGNYQEEFQKNNISLSSHNIISSAVWIPAYKYIYAANLAIERISNSTNLSPSVKSTLTAEAKFIRAFCYFYLVNLFGDVPLIIAVDYVEDQHTSRTPAAVIYQQMIKDLQEARSSLGTAYIGGEKTRPNRWAATALLARVQLYNKNWQEAASLSSEVISSGAYQLTDLRKVFLKNSTEAIWQLQNVNPLYNTWEGKEFLVAGGSAQPTYLLSDPLINAFENADLRRTAWDSTRIYLGQVIHIPAKYRNTSSNVAITEYYMVLRLAEQYLIRAEAYVQQNNITGAQQDVNTIRFRAGLKSISGNDQTTMLAYIEQERRVELFSEWGHRWLDLKRTGRVSAIISAINPINWQQTDELWPIPQSEINLNPSLVQNPGY